MNIKSLIFNKAYLQLCSLPDNENICSIFNSDDEEYESLISSVKDILHYEMKNIELDIQSTQRNIDKCYKTKKYRSKEKDENKKREVYNVKVERKLSQYDLIKYNEKQDRQEEIYSAISDALENLENKCVNDNDVELIKEIVCRKKLNSKFEIVITVITLLIFTSLLILKFFL